MNVSQYAAAKDEIARIKKKANMAEGAFDRDLKALSEVCGTSDVARAERFLEDKRTELQDARDKLDAMSAEFMDKWSGKF